MPPVENAHDAIRIIEESAGFAALFGPLPSGDRLSLKAALRARFRALALEVHPDRADRFPPSLRLRAEAAFRRLVALSREAEAAIDADRYPDELSVSAVVEAETFTIASTQTAYTLNTAALARGAHSTIYSGRSAAGMSVVVKAASEARDNAFLDREIEVLERFHREPELAEVARFVPELLDTCLIDQGGRRLRVSVFDHLDDQISVAGLMAAFPGGMDPADAAWVCRRLLAQVSAAGMLGVVHGAVFPEHLLVGIATHDPWYLGWTHSVESGEALRDLVDGRRDFYPPEVLNGRPADNRSDLFMAGKTMLALLGGDPASGWLPGAVPEAMAAVVRRCIERDPARRYRSGKRALDALSAAARGLWGKRYRRLVLP